MAREREVSGSVCCLRDLTLEQDGGWMDGWMDIEKVYKHEGQFPRNAYIFKKNEL